MHVLLRNRLNTTLREIVAFLKENKRAIGLAQNIEACEAGKYSFSDLISARFLETHILWLNLILL